MVQKYRDSIQANFAIYDTRNFVGMLPQDMAGFTSSIATPAINVYKTRLDLASIQFVAAEEVKDFTILANVLSATSAAPVATTAPSTTKSPLPVGITVIASVIALLAIAASRKN